MSKIPPEIRYKVDRGVARQNDHLYIAWVRLLYKSYKPFLGTNLSLKTNFARTTTCFNYGQNLADCASSREGGWTKRG